MPGPEDDDPPAGDHDRTPARGSDVPFVVDALKGARAQSLGVQVEVSRLLYATSWKRRFDLLRKTPELVDRSVAALCFRHGDSELGHVVLRCAEVGVARTEKECEAVPGLHSPLPDVMTGESLAVRLASIEVARQSIEQGASWLRGSTVVSLREVLEGVRTNPELVQSAAPPLLQALVSVSGVNGTATERVLSCVKQTWQTVWSSVALGEVEDLREAIPVARMWSAVFDDQFERVDFRLRDLDRFLVECAERGLADAIDQHRLVLSARIAVSADAVEQSSWSDDAGEIAAAVAGECAGYYQRTGSKWVLEAAVAAAQVAYEHAKISESRQAAAEPLAERASMWGALQGEAVAVGIAPVGDLARALDLQREAVALTAPSDLKYARRASNLGNRLSQSVRVGLLVASSLLEAIELQEAALATPGLMGRDRAAIASNLATLMAEAVNAGITQPTVLTSAVGMQRQAFESAPDEDTDRPRLAGILATRIAEAVRAGELDSDELSESVRLQQWAVENTAESHPMRAGRVSNLASRLSEAVACGLRPVEDLRAAIGYQAEAVDRTATSSELWASFASNYGARLAEGVLAGLVPAEDLATALRYSRSAYRVTQAEPSSRARRASNLAGRLAENVQAGLLLPDALIEAVELMEEAMAATPPRHIDRSTYATNLAGMLCELVRRGVGARTLLLRAFELHQEALDSVTEGHPDRLLFQNNMATVLGDMVRNAVRPADDLIEALRLQEGVVAETPAGHADRQRRVANWASLVSDAARYGLRPVSDLLVVIETQQRVLDSTPSGHPLRALTLSNYAGVVSDAMRHGVLTPASAAEVMSEILDEVWLTARLAATPSARRQVLDDTASVALVAPHVMLQGAGCPSTVEAVEATRGASFDRDFPPALPAAVRETTLGTRYEAAAVGYRLARRRANDQIGNYEHAYPHVQRLAEAIVEVRANHVELGVEPDFAGRPTFQQVVDGLADGETAIYVIPGLAAGEKPQHASPRGNPTGNVLATGEAATAPDNAASEHGTTSEAVAPNDLVASSPRVERLPGFAIVLADGHQAHRHGSVIELPELDHVEVAARLDELLAGPQEGDALLAWLWNTVVQPLVFHAESRESRSTSGGTNADHPTGPAYEHHEAPTTLCPVWTIVCSGHLGLLPIHAAGEGDRWLDDHAAVQSASSLLRPRYRGEPAARGQLVAVAEAAELHFLDGDYAVAVALLEDAVPMARDATADDILSALVDAETALLAGHATHSLTEGAALGFSVPSPQSGDGAPDTPLGTVQWLTADALARLPRKHRGAAFISACSSGQTATNLPNESLGLPGALISVGFTHVVATMWPVSDAVAFVAMSRHLELRAALPHLSTEQIAHQTRRWMRRSTRAELLRWLNNLDDRLDMPESVTRRLRSRWTNTHMPYPLATWHDWAAYAAYR